MKMLVIDGNSILNRAFYGVKLLTTKKGEFTNALVGFMNIYIKNVREVNPDRIAVAFDLRSPTFRHKAVATYKANRKGMPSELAAQLPLIKELLRLMGITVIECEGYEADDILGTLAQTCSRQGIYCDILTGDKDSLQLIDGCINVRLATNRDVIVYTSEKFRETYGFEPINLIDLKALMGDSSDNISGVAGIGEKTASSLIKEYATVENLYANIETMKATLGLKTKLTNGEQAAMESKWLATIKCDVPIDCNLENYAIKPFNDGLGRFLSNLEMYKLMDILGVTSVQSESEKTGEDETALPEPVFHEDFSEIFAIKLQSCCYMFDGVLRVVSGNDIYTTCIKEEILQFFAFESAKITMSAKSHYRYAFENGGELRNVSGDAEICGYLLNVSGKDYCVEKLCQEYNIRYLGEYGEYADLLSLSPLFIKLVGLVEAEGMLSLMNDIELPLTEVLASMEHHGIAVDTCGITGFGITLKELIEETSQMIYDDAGCTFNIASPKQLGVILFEKLNLPAKKKTKTGYSTDVEVLEELRNHHPIIENILKYRHYAKLNSTYVEGLLKVVGDDGKVHTSFNQTETRTGRLSSTEPNMQNIPVRTKLGSEMRKFFVADEGKIFLDADYSQIELRVMAHLSGDPNMIEAFINGEDIHTATAAQVFDMPQFMVTSEMRSAAKAVNFGIIYGIGAFSLAKDINVPLAKAKEYIDGYFAKFSKVKKFIDSTVENAIKNGSVTTVFGRKRVIPELGSSNKILQAAGKRIAMNTPVQGTAADLIKIAMVNVYRRLKDEKLNARMILQVHDELIVEADFADRERTAEVLKEEMQNAFKMSVPLVAEVNEGASWYDAKG